ncbi:PDR/VanB family oxidoreductase [Paraburkholderia unamae]|uniref:Vanillate O-demethylase ferredoxin subunit n=1 Tax=Paraburkholderia unamae TaxID=219649 RepID=A0ABX5KAI4_9BURK|nr:PDR/VanB family oxidoreductase [Paraburkholderia unamae]PVX61170.1 vanillate O-demethylase ferredoxin subunit [Paraburkholderia unamae]
MIEVVVKRLSREAEGVLGVELVRADGGALPSFEAGAHVDVALAHGLMRQYSLCNDPVETHRYCLGVGLATPSRGGSHHVHETLREGDRLAVSPPRTLFALAREGAAHRFIAGGIGITPILSMIRACERAGARWSLDYAVRSRERAAYLGFLSTFGARVRLHVDDEGTRPQPQAWLDGIDAHEHVYCCGPAAMMDAVAQAAEARGVARERVHFERFAAPPAAASEAPHGDAPPASFTVVLARSGQRCTVEADESILTCLERHGHALPHACREGLCGSCETPLIEGAAEHRDFVLDEAERAANRRLMICVSRSRTPELVLDL